MTVTYTQLATGVAHAELAHLRAEATEVALALMVARREIRLLEARGATLERRLCVLSELLDPDLPAWQRDAYDVCLPWVVGCTRTRPPRDIAAN